MMLEPTRKSGASSASDSKSPESHSVLPSAPPSPTKSSPSALSNLPRLASEIPIFCAKASSRNFASGGCNPATRAAPLSHLNQSVGTAARFLDLQGHVVHRRAARRAALVPAMVGMTMNDGAHLEAVDRFAKP